MNSMNWNRLFAIRNVAWENWLLGYGKMLQLCESADDCEIIVFVDVLVWIISFEFYTLCPIEFCPQLYHIL